MERTSSPSTAFRQTTSGYHYTYWITSFLPGHADRSPDQPGNEGPIVRPGHVRTGKRHSNRSHDRPAGSSAKRASGGPCLVRVTPGGALPAAVTGPPLGVAVIILDPGRDGRFALAPENRQHAQVASEVDIWTRKVEKRLAHKDVSNGRVVAARKGRRSKRVAAVPSTPLGWLVEEVLPPLARDAYLHRRDQLKKGRSGSEGLGVDELRTVYADTLRRLFRLVVEQAAVQRGLNKRHCPVSVAAVELGGRRLEPIAALAGLQRRLDEQPWSTRWIGALYEELQTYTLQVSQSGPGSSAEGGWSISLVRDRAVRKSTGCFYTPEPIVEHLVAETVGPLLERRLAGWRRQWEAGPFDACEAAANLFDFRLLDPAVGTGWFLSHATDFLCDRIETALRALPARRRAAVLRRLCDGPTESADAKRVIRAQVAARCLFGLDCDPLAVELTRAALWLDGALPTDALAALRENIRCCDALLDDLPFTAGQFDAVIGNPPYGAAVELQARRELRRRLPQMRHNGDTVVGFIERTGQWVGRQGRVGLVVPKALTYSYAWRHLRKFLGGKVCFVTDVSCGWKEVRLEQVVLGFEPRGQHEAYRTARFVAGRLHDSGRISSRWAERFETLPCALSRAERRWVDALQVSTLSLGEVCKTFRGLPAQSALQQRGELPVLGGRDLQRWRIRGASGYLPLDAPVDVTAFRQEKLLFQNIIAHVKRPTPHIRLIGTLDRTGGITLDTVNNLVARLPGLRLPAILALLHAETVNRFVYTVVYNRAIRTMHFDQYFLDKIPLPAGFDEVQDQLADLAVDAIDAVESGRSKDLAQIESEIDRCVAASYGVSP